MSHEVSCVVCGNLIDTPRLAHPWADRVGWIVCPHCQTRNVNPAAIAEDEGGHLQWLAVLGVLVVVAGILGGVLGTFVVALQGFAPRHPDREPGGWQTLACMLGFTALTVAGFLMIRAAMGQAGRAGGVLLVLALSVAVAAAGLTYAFAGMGR